MSLAIGFSLSGLINSPFTAFTRGTKIFMDQLSLFIRRLVIRALVTAVLLGLAVAAGAYWLFAHDSADFEAVRQDRLGALNAERIKFKAASVDVEKKLARLSGETTAQLERLKQADSIIVRLNELESTWEKYFGNRAQQKANAEQLERMQTVRDDAGKKVLQSKKDYTRATWERDGIEIALAKTEAGLKQAEVKRSRVRYYVEAAWEWESPWAVAAAWLFLLGPTARRIARFFLKRGGRGLTS